MLKENGFTLIEMLVVLLVISFLLIITIPNFVNYNNLVEDKGCEAFEDLLQSEVQLYKLEHQSYPTSIDELNIEDNTCTELNNYTIIDGEVKIGS
ncbi:competence type IV pilus major pilin ComGC [Aquisalibacillus elongatus]|uniref:Competence protein ComGC n=1 Tax=Aquisalibacillus elongatus TaxID=485577 RepID=A0A3N5BFI2_9BACI|nr:competence type IV pilus major pilin ComGC [Aquisalibacillus elongatus]RPF55639.1 competence protein ComGC [Aquisalibacillus elongatus]